MRLNQKDGKKLKKHCHLAFGYPTQTVIPHNMNNIFNFSLIQGDQHSNRPYRINLSPRLHNKSAGWQAEGAQGAWATHTVTSDSCSLVRFSGWLTAVMPYSTGLAEDGRKALRMALLATFMKDAMACQPLLLYHT